MVEFGLKLEDNKVSEWSELYLDYEALKKELKKAKKSQKKYEELYQQNPIEAEAITKAFRSGDKAHATTDSSLSMQDFLTLTKVGQDKEQQQQQQQQQDPSDISRQSILHLTTIHSERGNIVADGNDDNDEEVGVSTEYTALLKRQDSNKSLDTAATNKSSYTEQKIIKQSQSFLALSNISDHIFSTSNKENSKINLERKIRNSLVDIDEQAKAFDKLFYKQQKKVVSFYYSQLQELQSRLEYMVGSVARSQGSGKYYDDGIISEEFGGGGGGGGTDTSNNNNGKIISPFPKHRKQASSMGQKVEELIHHLTDSVRSNNSNNQNQNQNHETTTTTINMKTKRRVRNTRLGKIPVSEKNGNKNSKMSLQCSEDDEEESENNDPEWEEKRIAEAESIKRSLVDQYRVSKLLHNYSMMNITGFVKIIKKFDKTIPSEKGRFKDALITRNMLNDGKAVDVLCHNYEVYYANWFCDGDKIEAKAQMLTKRGDGLDMDWSQLQLGYRLGMCAILALWIAWDCIWGLIANGKSTIGSRPAFTVFRACGGLLLLQWFWGFSVFMWNRYRVNYIFLFDFNPRIVSTPVGIVKDAVDNTLLYMSLMLLYYKVRI
jgi:hypothetical protein